LTSKCDLDLGDTGPGVAHDTLFHFFQNPFIYVEVIDLTPGTLEHKILNFYHQVSLKVGVWVLCTTRRVGTINICAKHFRNLLMNKKVLSGNKLYPLTDHIKL
jgi:hypothetical protein